MYRDPSFVRFNILPLFFRNSNKLSRNLRFAFLQYPALPSFHPLTKLKDILTSKIYPISPDYMAAVYEISIKDNGETLHYMGMTMKDLEIDWKSIMADIKYGWLTTVLARLHSTNDI